MVTRSIHQVAERLVELDQGCDVSYDELSPRGKAHYFRLAQGICQFVYTTSEEQHEQFPVFGFQWKLPTSG